MRLKLTQPGFTTLTGKLHTVPFVNGIAEDITPHLADIIGANFRADLLDDAGNVIRQAGEAATIPHRNDPPEGEE